MKITLFSKSDELCEFWKQYFAGEDDVTVFCGDYSELDRHDCIVAPGNSFGIMNGGLDLLIRDEVDILTQDNLQWAIQTRFNGLLPVGEGLMLETLSDRFRFMAYCPTMVFPEDVRGSLNTLSSFFAALKLAAKYPIKSMACSGMAAGVGQVPPQEVAAQMQLAYQLFSEKKQYRNLNV